MHTLIIIPLVWYHGQSLKVLHDDPRNSHMNYRHSYHTGGFADVFKHVLLIGLIETLLRKDKPFCYMETHAGIGSYDLHIETTQKTQEYARGILKLWKSSIHPAPEWIVTYLQIVQKCNNAKGSSKLRYYPGSPCLMRNFLRPNDRMILNELHPQDILLLKQEFSNDRQVAVHHLNGYQALKAFLPPKECRGLVFIDPSFENPDEFTLIQQQLTLTIPRWRTGMYAIWYPIKEITAVNHFYQGLKASTIRKILCCEFRIPPVSTGLNGCGMMIINPPWQWENKIEKTLSWLCQVLGNPTIGSYSLNWLVQEP